MTKLKRIFILAILMLIMVSVSLGAAGCKNGQEHPNEEHPSSEHPTGEHPK